MAIKILQGLEPWWWTPPGQEGDEKPARFKLGPLTKPQMFEIKDHVDLTTMQLKGAGIVLAYKAGCLDWENITDDSGAPVPFNKRTLEQLDPTLLALMADEIIAKNFLSEADRKN